MASDRAEFLERLHTSALSKWELGDLLGIHPHLLPDYEPSSLGHLPARLIVEVAHHLDMHPVDLVSGLDTVLHNPRLHTRREPVDLDDAADLDALTVLNELATATAPLTTDQLADVLDWTLERVTTALSWATTTPELAGPFALRRVAASTYTVTPRLDLLTGANRRRLHDIARWNQPLDVDQANVLLAALVLHNNEYAGQPGLTYGEWREGHLDTERELRVSGLLYADHKPEAAKLHPEVLYSLRCQETPRADGH
jgi:hypothetical protein